MGSDKMRILVVDCSQLCYSSAFALGDLSYDELPTGVIFGFLLQIFRLASEFGTREFIFCWDSRKRKREILYPEYKADRREKSPFSEEEHLEIRLQMSILRERVLPELGFKNSFIVTGLEADDLIACVVKDFPGSVVVSNDSDLYQLLDLCEMYFPGSKGRFCANDLIAKYGVKPEGWIDVLAIVGTHNNVSGIEGAGTIKAIQYLKGKLSDGKIKKRIESDEGQAIRKRNLKVITLPLEQVMLDIQLPDRFDIDRWLDVFNRYDFRSFTSPEGMKNLKTTFFDRW